MPTNVINQFESQYKFIDPIRVFKANDPFYFELQNVNIKQLQQNCLFLRDYLLNSQFVVEDVTRAGLGELRPYFEGSDRILKIKPGRFTARINDAYTDGSILQKLVYLSKDNLIKKIQSKEAGLVPGNVFNTIISRVRQSISTNANGLEERIGFWAQIDGDTSVPTQLITGFGPSQGLSIKSWPSLRVFAKKWFTSLQVGVYGSDNQDLHNELVKQWRGVARTAVVDVNRELTINIPEFTLDDFKYWNNNTLTNPESTPLFRIDMVFVYSKPIDSSSVTLPRFDSQGNPTVITEPVLGLIKGAGLLFAGTSSTGTPFALHSSNNTLLDSQGIDLMNANAADSSSVTNGFRQGPLTAKDVRGSFPSPDDLLNFAPNLCLDLETNDLQLIGQSILPICYVLVENNSLNGTNQLGQTVLTDNDLIDIRPFLRTAELAYNERAGIAAAFPQLSLGNPAVGKQQLQAELQALKDAILGTVNTPGELADSRPIARGYVWGGLLYGPEGTLWSAYELAQTNGTTSKDVTTAFIGGLESNGLNPEIKAVLGFPENSEIQPPIFPTWDFPEWTQTITDRGLCVNDWMDVGWWLQNGQENYLAGPPGMFIETRSKLNLIQGVNLYQNNKPMVGTDGATAKTLFKFCTKKITITNIPAWVKDTSVICEYVNCSPQTDNGGKFNRDGIGGWGGLHVTKSEITNGTQTIFITCSWTSDQGETQASISETHPKIQRNNWEFEGFLATTPKYNKQIGSGGHTYKTKLMGACIYPTVEFIIMGLTDAMVNPLVNNYGIHNNPANKTFQELPTLLPGVYDLQAANAQGIRPWDTTIAVHSSIKAQ